MKKGIRKMAGMLLTAGMLVGLPWDTVMAGQAEADAYDAATEEYWTAESAFWSALDAYCGVWDDNDNCISIGAYDAYVTAAESCADNADALYAAAQTARTGCTDRYQELSEKYDAVEAAYGALSEDERPQQLEEEKTEIENGYANAGACVNDLAVLAAPQSYAARGAFWDAMEAYWTKDENFWKEIEEYYGPDENTPGSYEKYMEALESGTANAQELYAAAVTDRADALSVFEGLTQLYDAAVAAYDAVDDAAKTEAEVQEKKNLEDSYADAVQTKNELEPLTAPEEYVPEPVELSTVWIDANGNFDGNAASPVYWKVNSAGKLVAATAEDWSLKAEKTAEGMTLTLRDFHFTSVPDEEDIAAVWSETSLIVELQGTNTIAATKGDAFGVEGNLVTRGTGSLALNAASGEVTGANGEKYVPVALYVYGTWTNSAIVTGNSGNKVQTVYANQIVNTGTVTVGEGQVIRDKTNVYDKLVPPAQNSGQDPAQNSGQNPTQGSQGSSTGNTGSSGGASPAQQTVQTVSPMTGEVVSATAVVAFVLAAALMAGVVCGRRRGRQ